MIKVLNLFAGIGGNRKLWGGDIEVTAIEYDQATADVYKQYFPNDNVIVTDAHDYLLKNYMNFNFIWSSPPCPTHSRINHAKTRNADFPDMKLYQEIIFLNQWFDGKFVVENVIPYYDYLINPTIILDRHPFWTNFKITHFAPKEKAFIRMQGGKVPFEKIYGFNVDDSKIKDKRKALRNCVHPEIGLHIFNTAMGIIQKSNTTQTTLEL